MQTATTKITITLNKFKLKKSKGEGLSLYQLIMALATKASNYAPDIYRALDGLLLVYKPVRMGSMELVQTLKERLSEKLNSFETREISKKLVILGGIDEEKRIVQVPNLADHPLVVGPRYVPWEIKIGRPIPLGYLSSGLQVLTFGRANKYFLSRLMSTRLINVYQLTGKFGYITDNFFYNGKIQDKTTYKHVRHEKLDAALARIESSQQHRLFDSANVKLDSDEAYELAKSWPSRPPSMANWPVIYRLRCTHLNLPEFKIEVTCTNENTLFLSQLVHEVGLMLKTGAYTDSIKRIKLGPWDIKDSLLVDKCDLQTLVNHFDSHRPHYPEILKMLRESRMAGAIRTNHKPDNWTKEPQASSRQSSTDNRGPHRGHLHENSHHDRRKMFNK